MKRNPNEDAGIELPPALIPVEKVLDHLDPNNPGKLDQAEHTISSSEYGFYFEWLQKCLANNLESTAELIVSKINSYDQDPPVIFRTILIKAVMHGHDNIIEFLGEKVPNLIKEIKDKNNLLAIFRSVIKDNKLATMSLLLKFGLAIDKEFEDEVSHNNKRKYVKRNAFHYVVAVGTPQLVQLLIEHIIANKKNSLLNETQTSWVKDTNDLEMTPLEIAIERKNPEITVILLNAKVDLHKKGAEEPLLKMLIKGDCEDEFKKYLEHYKRQQDKDFLGKMIYDAILNGSFKIFIYLINLEAPIEDHPGKVLQAACQGGSLLIMTVLASKGFDIQNTKFTESPVIIAIKYGCLDILQYLISLDSTELNDFKGDLTKKIPIKNLSMYPSTVAICYGCLPILKFLKSENALMLEDDSFSLAIKYKKYVAAVWLLKQGTKFELSCGEGLYKKFKNGIKDSRTFTLLLELDCRLMENANTSFFLQEITDEPALQDKEKLQQLLRERYLKSIPQGSNPSCTGELLSLLCFDPIAGLDFALEHGLPADQLAVINKKIGLLNHESGLLQYVVYHQVRLLLIGKLSLETIFHIRVTELHKFSASLTLSLNLYKNLEQKIPDFCNTRYASYLRAIYALEIFKKLEPSSKNIAVQKLIVSLRNEIEQFLKSEKPEQNPEKKWHKSAVKLFTLQQSFKVLSDENSAQLFLQAVSLDLSEDKIKKISQENYLSKLHACVSKAQEISTPQLNNPNSSLIV